MEHIIDQINDLSTAEATAIDMTNSTLSQQSYTSNSGDSLETMHPQEHPTTNFTCQEMEDLVGAFPEFDLHVQRICGLYYSTGSVFRYRISASGFLGYNPLYEELIDLSVVKNALDNIYPEMSERPGSYDEHHSKLFYRFNLAGHWLSLSNCGHFTLQYFEDIKDIRYHINELKSIWDNIWPNMRLN
jgi:hypothetical protein